MAIFGTECYAYTQNKSKLDARCDKGIFLGYDRGSPAYLVLFPESGIIKRVRNVKFTNKVGVNKPDHKVGYDVDFLPMEVREGQTAPNMGQGQEDALSPRRPESCGSLHRPEAGKCGSFPRGPEACRALPTTEHSSKTWN